MCCFLWLDGCFRTMVNTNRKGTHFKPDKGGDLLNSVPYLQNRIRCGCPPVHSTSCWLHGDQSYGRHKENMQAWSGLSISNPTLTLTPAVWKSFHLFAFWTLWFHLKKKIEIIVATAIPGPCNPQGIKSFPPLHYLPPCTQSMHPAQLGGESGKQWLPRSLWATSVVLYTVHDC